MKSEDKLVLPMVLKKYIFTLTRKGEWNCLDWTDLKWLEFFGNKLMKFTSNKKIINTHLSEPQWEGKCLTGKHTFNKMLIFKNGEDIMINENKVNQIDSWLHLNYFYLDDCKNTQMLDEAMSWKEFGLHDITAKDCTLWIGTEGANTPCHLDTYGCNIVIQLKGKKRWTLFPKSQTEFLYPTRVPYEETSIYSMVGFPCPSLECHQLLANTTPYSVVLEPGDVLFVPKHWWHFVECLEYSISINAWVPASGDNEDKLKEAIALYQMSNFSRTMDASAILDTFNPNMIHIATYSAEEAFNILENTINSFNAEEKKSSINKVLSHIRDTYGDNVFEEIHSKKLTDYYEQFKNIRNLEKPSNQADRTALKWLINSFIDDKVLTSIKDNLIQTRLNK